MMDSPPWAELLVDVIMENEIEGMICGSDVSYLERFFSV